MMYIPTSYALFLLIKKQAFKLQVHFK